MAALHDIVSIKDSPLLVGLLTVLALGLSVSLYFAAQTLTHAVVRSGETARKNSLSPYLFPLLIIVMIPEIVLVVMVATESSLIPGSGAPVLRDIVLATIKVVFEYGLLINVLIGTSLPALGFGLALIAFQMPLKRVITKLGARIISFLSGPDIPTIILTIICVIFIAKQTFGDPQAPFFIVFFFIVIVIFLIVDVRHTIKEYEDEAPAKTPDCKTERPLLPKPESVIIFVLQAIRERLHPCPPTPCSTPTRCPHCRCMLPVMPPQTSVSVQTTPPHCPQCHAQIQVAVSPLPAKGKSACETVPLNDLSVRSGGPLLDATYHKTHKAQDRATEFFETIAKRQEKEKKGKATKNGDDKRPSLLAVIGWSLVAVISAILLPPIVICLLFTAGLSLTVIALVVIPVIYSLPKLIMVWTLTKMNIFSLPIAVLFAIPLTALLLLVPIGALTDPARDAFDPHLLHIDILKDPRLFILNAGLLRIALAFLLVLTLVSALAIAIGRKLAPWQGIILIVFTVIALSVTAARVPDHPAAAHRPPSLGEAGHSRP